MGMIEQNGDLDLIMGEATFTGPTSIQVRSNEGTKTHLIADTIIIATGGRPAMPPIPGLNNVPSLNSTSIMDLDTIPEHLLVLGGGYIGLEFGQMFRRFGSRVTIVDILPQLYHRSDPIQRLSPPARPATLANAISLTMASHIGLGALLLEGRLPRNDRLEVCIRRLSSLRRLFLAGRMLMPDFRILSCAWQLSGRTLSGRHLWAFAR